MSGNTTVRPEQADYAERLAARIMSEFNEKLCAYMGSTVHRRQAAESQRRLTEVKSH